MSLSTYQVAELLNISYRHVLRLINTGSIPAEKRTVPGKLGGVWCITCNINDIKLKLKRRGRPPSR